MSIVVFIFLRSIARASASALIALTAAAALLAASHATFRDTRYRKRDPI
jgi:hypothetical protein